MDSGKPDHDDFITVQNKIDDLIQNSNDQFGFNSEIFKEINLYLNNSKRPLRLKKLHLEYIVCACFLTIL